MIIECYYCESKVDAVILSESYRNYDDNPFSDKVVFLSCPICSNPMVAIQEEIYAGTSGDTKWSSPNRVWPIQEKPLSNNLPLIVRNSLLEARKCYKAGAYRACAVMAGAAIEGICIEYTSKKSIAEGLKVLLEKNIIDKRIYEWGETIRQHRNIGAHAIEQNIMKDEAKDLLDFTIAIGDYIYDLTFKFQEFKKRQEERMKKVKEVTK